MRFDDRYIEELKARLRPSDIIGRSVKLKRQGREFVGLSPFSKEKSPSFFVNDDKGFFHDFSSGKHGDVISFLQETERLSFVEAVSRLAAEAGMALPAEDPQAAEREQKRQGLADWMDLAQKWFAANLRRSVGKATRDYLERRGLPEDQWDRFGLGYAPNDREGLKQALIQRGARPGDLVEAGMLIAPEGGGQPYDRFRDRLMFPILDARGRIVSFGGRAMNPDDRAKYLNGPESPLFHKGSTLYGLPEARRILGAEKRGEQGIIVVEGYMDVIALAESGYQGAVAPLGTAMTEEQLGILWRLLPPLDAREAGRDYSPILCFDGDKAGIRAASRAVERALPLLTPTQTVRVAYLPEGEDPDSLIKQSGKGAMQAVLDQAKPMIDALWDITAEGRRLQTPEERGAFIAALKQKTARIADETLRRLYQDAVQQKLSTAFQWQKSADRGFGGASGGQFWGKDRNKRGFSAPIVTNLARKQPRSANLLRERVLMAIILNHPALFHDFGEDLARIDFADPQLEALRQQTLAILSDDSHEPLDAAELYRHLSGGDECVALRPALTSTLSEQTYTHARFARPSQSVEQARQGWKSIWNKYLQELYTPDLEAAKRLYREDPSEANLERMMALRNQIEALTHESAESDNVQSDLATTR